MDLAKLARLPSNSPSAHPASRAPGTACFAPPGSAFTTPWGISQHEVPQPPLNFPKPGIISPFYRWGDWSLKRFNSFQSRVELCPNLLAWLYTLWSWDSSLSDHFLDIDGCKVHFGRLQGGLRGLNPAVIVDSGNANCRTNRHYAVCVYRSGCVHASKPKSRCGLPWSRYPASLSL